MRIIFLDIDGVLNHACTREMCEGCIGVDQGNLEAFRDLVEESNKEEETKACSIFCKYQPSFVTEPFFFVQQT